MANCPRCGTSDFYPSFSGKGECVRFGCELYVPPYKGFPQAPHHTSNDTSQLEKDLAAINWGGWTHPNRSVHPTTTVPGPVPYVPVVSLTDIVAAVATVNDVIPLHDYRIYAIGFIDNLRHHGHARTNNNGNVSPMRADITVGQVTIRVLVDPAFIDLTLI